MLLGPPAVPSPWRSRCSRTSSRANMKAAPDNHTAKSTAPTVRLREIPMPRSSRPPSWVAQDTHDAPNPLKKPPSGSLKLTDVITQIQYFHVALAPPIEVRAHATRQRIE